MHVRVIPKILFWLVMPLAWKFFALCLAVTGVEGLLCAIVPERFLLEYVFADDYFYYLVLARNSVRGLGPTFDGAFLTNGFHPLYFGLLTLLSKVSGLDGWPFARAGVVIPLFAHNAAGALVAKLFLELRTPKWGVVFVLIWWCSPFAVQIPALGLEAPLATLFLVLLVHACVRLNQNWSFSAVLLCGVWLGLAILSRTDSLLALPIFGLWALASGLGSSSVRGVATIGVVYIVAFLVSAPWWIWSIGEFGTILQCSGVATRLHSLHGGDGFFLDAFRSVLRYVLLIVTASCVPLVCLLVLSRRSNGIQVVRLPINWLAVCAVAGFMVMLAGYYTLYARHVQGWYVHSTCLGLLACGVYLLSRGSSLRSPIMIGSMVVITMVGLFFVLQVQKGPSLQWRGYMLAQWINDNTENYDVVGTWNSGIVGYFSKRQVFNLDGVVNNKIVEIMQGHNFSGLVSLKPYIDERGITVLLDYEPILPQDLSGMGFRSTVVEGEMLAFLRK